MLSYQFLINNKLVNDDALSNETKDNLDNGRTYLISGEFKPAIDCFNQVIESAEPYSTLYGWGQLLSHFTNIMEKQFIAGCEKPNIEHDAITTLVIDLLKNFARGSLITAEYDDFKNVQRYLRQLIIIKTEANEKLDFTELHHYAWSLCYINNIITSDKIAEAHKAIKSLE